MGVKIDSFHYSENCRVPNRKVVDAKQRVSLDNYSPAPNHFGIIEVISAETEDDGVPRH